MTCPACAVHRHHTPAEFTQYHPLAGHGFARGASLHCGNSDAHELGWCCAAAAVAHDAEEKAVREKMAGGNA